MLTAFPLYPFLYPLFVPAPLRSEPHSSFAVALILYPGLGKMWHVLKAEYHPRPVLVNIVLLEHSHCCLWPLSVYTEVLNSYSKSTIKRLLYLIVALSGNI